MGSDVCMIGNGNACGTCVALDCRPFGWMEVPLHTVGRGNSDDSVLSPFSKLVDAVQARSGHGGHNNAHSLPITTGVKLVFGLGFCVENMFDVASDTLLAKYYSGWWHTVVLLA